MNQLDIMSAVRTAQEDIGSIYMLINLRNGKRYVGQTVKPPRVRVAEHFSHARSGLETHLYHGIRKHGESSFAWRVLVSGVPVAQLDTLEQFWIRFFDTCHGPGYNETEGGLRPRHTDATRAKISESAKRQNQERVDNGTHHWLTDEHRVATGQRTRERNRRLAEIGQHQWQTDEYRNRMRRQAREQAQRQIDDGTHHFLGDRNPVYRQVEDGTHPWLSDEHRVASRDRQMSLIESGQHNWLNETAAEKHVRYAKARQTKHQSRQDKLRDARLASIESGQQMFC